MGGNWLLLLAYKIYKIFKTFKIFKTYKPYKIYMAGMLVMVLILLLTGCAGAGDRSGAEEGRNSGASELSGSGISSGSAAEGDAAADREADSDRGTASGNGMDSERETFLENEALAEAIQAAPEEGLLRIGTSEAVKSMDVHKVTSSYMVPLNIYERLFDIKVNDDGTTELVPGLVREFSLSEDGRTYSFTLRDDAFFWDGSPVKASDVAFTFTRMLALPDSLQRDFADSIKGAEKVVSQKTDTLEGIRVLDDTRLTITLSRPFTGYIYQLATPSCSILSEEFVRGVGDAYGSDPEHTMGSGPYRVTELTHNRVVFERNPYYRQDQPVSVKKVELLVLDPAIMDKAFREQGLDILDCDYVNTETLKDIYKSAEWKDRLITRGCVDIMFFMLNMADRPLRDVRVRKAIQMAINRQKILDEIYDGDGRLVDGIYPEGLIGYCPENQGWLQYDPEGAKKLIEQVPEAGNCRIEIAANSAGSTRELTMLEMIRQDLLAVGLDTVIVNYDSDSRIYLRRKGRLMTFVGSWSADYNDPDNFIYSFFGSREKTLRHSSNYANETVLKRIAAARTIQNEKKRLKEYADLEKLLVQEEAVWVPLLSTDHLYILGDRVESFVPYWAGWSSMSFKDVTLK